MAAYDTGSERSNARRILQQLDLNSRREIAVDPKPAAHLTHAERGTFRGQYPSPDGRYVAMPVERWGASTLWSIDVDAAAKAYQAKKSQR